MAIYFYYNENGKRTSVTGMQLGQYIATGVIRPGTIVTSEDGTSQVVGSGGLSPVNAQPHALMTAKQRCETISGIFLCTGVLLWVIGGYMYNHNDSLLSDVESTELSQRVATDSYVSAMQDRVRYNLAMPEHVAGELSEAKRDAESAKSNLRSRSYSPGLVNTLLGLRTLLLLSGFVLMVVGWIIPE